MLMLILWLVSFSFFTCIGLLIFNRLYKNKLILARRLAPLITTQGAHTHTINEEDEKNKTIKERFIQPFLLKLGNYAEGKMPKQKMAQVEKRLQAAGFPFGLSARDFILLQVSLPVLIFLFFTIFLVPSAEEKSKVLALAAIGSIFTYFYTNYYLNAKSKQRIKEIEKAMPDFFDMLNVSIEAGMGLDGALKKVASQMDTPLSKEFLSTLEDMKLGKARKQAFIELRDRIPSDFFTSVMNSIIQADQMGIGMSRVLRTQTTRIREKYRFDAKERAMKAPVKMLIPMVIFIFPTLFIVLLGPVVVDLVTQFFM